MIYGVFFRQLLATAVIGELADSGYDTEHWRLDGLSRPHKIVNADPKLGANQVRYQARFVDDATGYVYNISVNCDPVTIAFGVIKEASGK